MQDLMVDRQAEYTLLLLEYNHNDRGSLWLYISI